MDQTRDTAPAKEPAPSPAPASAGATERLAMASARRPWRVISIWGAAVLASVFLAITLLHGLTTSSYVVGATESSRAGALYDKALGGASARQPTDVIVVSLSLIHI